MSDPLKGVDAHRCRIICEQKPTRTRSRDGRYHAECSVCGWAGETVNTITAAEGQGQWHQARSNSNAMKGEGDA